MCCQCYYMDPNRGLYEKSVCDMDLQKTFKNIF